MEHDIYIGRQSVGEFDWDESHLSVSVDPRVLAR